MSQTIQCGTTYTPDILNATSAYFYSLKEELIVIGLLAGLHGVLTILSTISFYTLLTRRRASGIPLTAVLLCLTIFVLFTSTTMYLVTYILWYHTKSLNDFFGYGMLYFFPQCPEVFNPLPAPPDADPDYAFRVTLIQGCAGAATLSINVMVGDIIVCWRACVIWHKNHIVKAACSLFLMATFVLAVLDSSHSCEISAQGIGLPLGAPTNSETVPGSLFAGIPIGIATCVLSLSTNILATLLVSYKAWQFRRPLKGFILKKVGGPSVEKLLTLLTESGILYSALWSVIVAYQVVQYDSDVRLDHTYSIAENNFLEYFNLFMNGALVPTIAIYPTIIIVLISLNRSYVERGISQHLESMATPDLVFATNTNTTSLHEGYGRRRSEALVFDGHESGSGDGEEEARGYTSQERKAEDDIAHAA